MSGGVTLAGVAAAVGAVAAVYTASQAGKSKGGGMALPPPAPLAPPAPQTPAMNESGLAQRQRAAAAGGIMSNIATSPAGDLSGASLTGKSLLGQ